MSRVLSSICLIVFGFVFSTTIQAEEAKAEKIEIGIHDKGSFFAFWGWNRGYFSKSDLTFKGDNYEFTIDNMTASDRPTAIGIDPYLNPFDITRPQTNVKIGYFFADKYAISFGVDHMKYIMDQEQTANITGNINVGSIHDGVYNNQPVYLGQRDENDDLSFLAFEHSDGLNYLNLEISRFDPLHTFSSNIVLSRILGVGVGAMLPRTNATLLKNDRHDAFHFSGWGTHIKGGLEFSYKKFFFRTELKVGYIDMPDIRTTKFESDTASQHFTFTEWTFLLGSYF